MQPASCKNDDQGQAETDDEFREVFPDFPFGNLASPGCDGCPRVIEMVNGPDDNLDTELSSPAEQIDVPDLSGTEDDDK